MSNQQVESTKKKQKVTSLDHWDDIKDEDNAIENRLYELRDKEIPIYVLQVLCEGTQNSNQVVVYREREELKSLFGKLDSFRIEGDPAIKHCISTGKPVKTVEDLYDVYPWGKDDKYFPQEQEEIDLILSYCEDAYKSLVLSCPLIDFWNAVEDTNSSKPYGGWTKSLSGYKVEIMTTIVILE